MTYENSANAQGVRNFKLVETYALVNDYLSWQIQVTNTGTQTLEMGDFGVPLPFNEYWFKDKDVIYESAPCTIRSSTRTARTSRSSGRAAWGRSS